MNKTDLIASVSASMDMPQEAAHRAVNATIETIIDAIGKGESVVLPGFGTFSRKHRNARKGINLRTGEKMMIPSCEIPSFKAGKRLRDAANRKKSQQPERLR